MVFGVDENGRVFRRDADDQVWRMFPAEVKKLWDAPWGFVYGVGLNGQVVYHDGLDWNTLRPARPGNGSLFAIFGVDGMRFAVGAGTSFVFDGQDWIHRPLANPSADRAGWAVSTDFAIAAGLGGAIDHWVGNAWENVPSPTTANLVGVWAHSKTEAYTIGIDGTLLHYDGVAWSLATTLPYLLSGIHGTAPDDIWVSPAVGGHMLHYDADSWKEMTLPTSQILTSVWAVSATDVFAVGYEGTALRYDGAEWKVLPTPTSERLIDVWARGPTEVFALTDEANILFFNGEEWVEHSTVPGGLGLQLWGDENSVFAAGRAITVFRLGI